MGKYGGRPREEGRPGADHDKRMKERINGRDPTKAPQMQSIRDQRKRLNDIERAIQFEKSLSLREFKSEQYANLAASCKPEVMMPSEIGGIVSLADLEEPMILKDLDGKTYFSGPRPDVLALHHLVKVLAKQVPLGRDAKPYDAKTTLWDIERAQEHQSEGLQRFVYVFGSSSNDIPADTPTRNLRGLESGLLKFAYRMTSGAFFSAEINGCKVQIPRSTRELFKGDEKELLQVRRLLRNAGIVPADHYTLRRIRDGNYPVTTPLHVIAEQQPYKTESENRVAVLSYLALFAPKR